MSGGTILRAELYGGGLKTAWRPLINLEHGTLCKQFGLDPNRFYFDLPSSAHGVGSSTVGLGGGRGAREISGYIFEAGRDRPVGKIVFAHAGQRFRDVDPMDRNEFERLDR